MTEIAQGLIIFAFNELSLPYIFADADKLNIANVKILDELMDFQKEEFIEAENC